MAALSAAAAPVVRQAAGKRRVGRIKAQTRALHFVQGPQHCREHTGSYIALDLFNLQCNGKQCLITRQPLMTCWLQHLDEQDFYRIAPPLRVHNLTCASTPCQPCAAGGTSWPSCAIARSQRHGLSLRVLVPRDPNGHEPSTDSQQHTARGTECRRRNARFRCS